jgi:hypothetical protein
MSVHERPDEREESGRSKFFKVLLMKDAYVRHGVGKEVKNLEGQGRHGREFPRRINEDLGDRKSNQ